jgi:hypothetical protein
MQPLLRRIVTPAHTSHAIRQDGLGEYQAADSFSVTQSDRFKCVTLAAGGKLSP